jgi:hypothetical protein
MMLTAGSIPTSPIVIKPTRRGPEWLPLLLVGLVLLLVGLLVVPDLSDFEGIPGQSLVVRGYVSNVCSLLGVGLVLAASVISAVKKQQQQPTPPPPPAIDHYS